MSESTKLRFLSAWYCPFAQRLWIALLEKGIPFKYEETDLSNKTEEFLKLNPRGLVPVLVHDDKIIYESAVCVEYIDETWPQNPKIMMEQPYDKAQVRIWGDYATSKIIPLFYSILRSDPENLGETQKSFVENIGSFVKAMSPTGNFFMGDSFSFADIMVYPWMQRLEVLKHFKNFEIPSDIDWYPRFQKWLTACYERESVTPTIPDMKKLIPRHKRYVKTK
ncbi:glutathione S-transferase U20-like [Octopus sinensis]|uniref:Glutathione S-transferase omega n=1 Tax=Octopus sinensis TaxID=2607531 RepID=A0A6P7SLL4_9MOLL|nr:glutathione S-transferase U20-like [Octopus sinensis]